MTIWTSFFLVLSAVILAYPFLTPGDDSYSGGLSSPGSPLGDSPGSAKQSINSGGPWHEEEVQLDLATGRLDPDDQGQDAHETSAHETGEGPAGGVPADAPESSEEDDESLP